MIYIITHKKFHEPFLDCENSYRVLHDGENLNCKSDYLRDDIGDNISNKNRNYCELTGLYWIWKNSNSNPTEIDGLIHYRRFFTLKNEYYKYIYLNKMPSILPYSIIEQDLKKYDIILPRKNKTFRTVKETYTFFHNEEDLILLGKAINKIEPKYYESYQKVLNSHSYYYANMMICYHDIMMEYAEWLFNILFEVEKYIDINKYKNDYQKRVFGFMAERLLQVWVEYNNLKVKEYDVFNTEIKDDNIFEKNIERLKRVFKINE